MKELLELFLTFAKIGVCTFGGGLAMLPIMERELCNKRSWVTFDELADYYAIGQCTPGIIAVNTATFVGCRRKGISGGIVATLGLVFPSIVIICLVAACLRQFIGYPAVIHAFNGIRACVCVLMANAMWKLGKSALVDWVTIIIFGAVLAVSLFLGLSPAILVIAAGAVGLAVRRMRGWQS